MLSATQVGIQQSMIVVHRHAHTNNWFSDSYTETEDYESFINPKILSASDHSVIVEEENISFPFIHANIRRFNNIRVQFLDEFENTQ